MGFVTGIIAHPLDNTLIYAKTDVGGIFRWNNVERSWVPLLDGKGVGNGIESVAIYEGDVNRVYVATDSVLYVSQDQGETWTPMNGLKVYMNGNGDWRQAGERLAIDPNGNGAVLLFGSRKDGLWRSTNNGINWSKIATIPNGSDGGVTFVTIDKTSGTSTTASQKIYVGVQGSGVYSSSDGGSNWELLSGGPATTLKPVGGAVASNGKAYFAYAGGPYGSGDGAIYILDNNTMSNITPANRAYTGFVGVSVDPNNGSHILAYEFNGGPSNAIHRSTNGGSTWTQLPFNNGSQPGTKNVTEPSYYPTWSSWTNGGQIMVDYAGNAWITTGFGVYRTQNIAGSPAQWVAEMKNLEELCVYVLKVPPVTGGADLFVGGADMGGFRLEDVDQVPTSKLLPNDFAYISGMSYSAGNPSFIAFVGSDQNGNTPKAQFSSNNGTTWTNFASRPTGAFLGNIAVSATDVARMVWAPLNQNWTTPANVLPHYTTDGGSTWTQSNGFPASGNDATILWSCSQFLTADKVNGMRFYYYEPGIWPGTTGNFYASTDGGVNFTKIKTGLSQWYQVKIESVPGLEGHVWFTTHKGSALSRTTDGGATWITVSSVTQSKTVGFGKPIAPSTYPTVFIYGEVGGQWGTFRSTDYGSTWTMIGGQLPSVRDIEGDMRTEGLVYVSTSGRGVFYGTPSAPPVNQAPVVNAGSDQTITFPSSATLNGSTSDDGLPSNTLSNTWSKHSGPGTVTFGDAADLSTTVGFSEEGTYVLRLTASDGELSSTSDVTIIVEQEAPTFEVQQLTEMGTDQWNVSYLDNEFRLYNPISNHVQIVLVDIHGDLSKVLYTGSIHRGEFKLFHSALPKGIYVFLVRTMDGRDLYRKILPLVH
jgi:hypothetical protein